MKFLTILVVLLCCRLIAAYPIRGRIMCQKGDGLVPLNKAIVAVRDNQGYNLGYHSNTESDKFGKFYLDAISFATTSTLELEVHHLNCGEAQFFKKPFTGADEQYDFGDVVLQS
ncbi:unnamed protein product [Bursaphelenchus xylophilus]|uniref:(pine wood nematode) hypothetical protein n=1 Tax=Bursaphelenchus xylophilus TaxID=6326 RepID=A0A1I7RWH8_BURXY|nr:unnamed protein product [Bursaphelenchus xylophilus]CAG9128388.1 unnamed protein product [Bursaphelenchus xylophilus]